VAVFIVTAFCVTKRSAGESAFSFYGIPMWLECGKTLVLAFCVCVCLFVCVCECVCIYCLSAIKAANSKLGFTWDQVPMTYAQHTHKWYYYFVITLSYGVCVCAHTLVLV